jgi:hypothetical protein
MATVNPQVRVSSAQRRLETEFANPLLGRLLRSQLHWPASRWLLLVSYEGRRSGRRFTFPASYSRVGATLVVVTPRHESTWWPNFQSPYECTLWHRGRERQVVGEVVTGPDRDDLLAAYLDDHLSMRHLLGVQPEDIVSPGRLPAAADEVAVVRFSPVG